VPSTFWPPSCPSMMRSATPLHSLRYTLSSAMLGTYKALCSKLSPPSPVSACNERLCRQQGPVLPFHQHVADTQRPTTHSRRSNSLLSSAHLIPPHPKAHMAGIQPDCLPYPALPSSTHRYPCAPMSSMWQEVFMAIPHPPVLETSSQWDEAKASCRLQCGEACEG
jgi:hypothetical protein